MTAEAMETMVEVAIPPLEEGRKLAIPGVLIADDFAVHNEVAKLPAELGQEPEFSDERFVLTHRRTGYAIATGSAAYVALVGYRIASRSPRDAWATDDPEEIATSERCAQSVREAMDRADSWLGGDW